MTDEQRRIVVAINPTASFGRSRGVGPRVAAMLAERGHLVTELMAGDFASLQARVADAVVGQPEALVVVGGDGMVSLGVEAVANTTVSLGIVPVGTGNDMARGLGIPEHDPATAVQMLLDALEREPRIVDTGVVEWSGGGQRRFAGVVSCGFDALVNERANRIRFPKGASRYTISIAFELAKLKPISYRIEHDDGVIETEGMLVSVANNAFIGGGMWITPEAKLDDGLLDIFVVSRLSRVDFLRIFPKVFKGEHVDDPRVTIVRTRRARIEADGIVGYADGERLGLLPVDVAVDPGSLRLLAPVPVPMAATAEEPSQSPHT